MTDGHRIPQDGSDIIASLTRRLTALERRQGVPSLQPALGSGIARQGRQITDWSDPSVLENGWYYSDLLSLNTPNPQIRWVGTTSSTYGGHGIQQVWSHDDTVNPPTGYVRKFHYHSPPETPEFSPWVTVAVMEQLALSPTVTSWAWATSQSLIGAVPNDGAYHGIGSWQPAWPAGAHAARVKVVVNASAAVNAAGFWRLRTSNALASGMDDRDFARVHNQAVPATGLGTVLTTEVTQAQGRRGDGTLYIDVYGSADGGGGPISVGDLSYQVQYITMA